MKPAKPAKKPNSGAPGVKLFITAASLAATLGGWAAISGQEAKPAPAPMPMPEPAVAPVVMVKLAPLPTLVPEVTPQTQLVMVNRPRPAAAAPQPAVPSTVVLREVSAPAQRGGGSAGQPNQSAPAPAANTRSSR